MTAARTPRPAVCPQCGTDDIEWSNAERTWLCIDDHVVPPGRVPGATPPRGVGTVAPAPGSPMNTGDPRCQPGGTSGTGGTLRRCDVKLMLTTEPEPVDWLIGGVVARGTLTLLAGREKEGKSLL